MNKQEKIIDIANESLSIFDTISVIANKKANVSSKSDAEQFASLNTFTGSGAVNNLKQISSDNIDSLKALAAEPAISRIVVLNEEGEENTIYISRGTIIPLKDKGTLASYKSQWGRLASSPIGEEIKLTIGGNLETFEILERVILKPSLLEEGWESKNSVFSFEDDTVSGVESFREVLGLLSVDDEPDLSLDDSSDFDALFGEQDPVVSDGIRHQVLSAIALRDQPILDQFQDNIFRLPLASQLIILGPPGTGKTTTLIKRLSQKINIEYLEESEQQQIEQSHVGIAGHSRSWLMFTPTDLLKHFVKEAFTREQVPASSDQIKTWNNHRSYLGRNVLAILQSSGSSGFILKEDKCLQDSTYEQPTAWFDEYISFHYQQLTEILTVGVKKLDAVSVNSLDALIKTIKKCLLPLERQDLIACYRQLHQIEPEITLKLKDLKSKCDVLLKRSLVQEFNKDKKLLSELAGFIDTLQKQNITTSDIEDDEDEEPVVNATPVQKAQQAFNKAIRSFAIAKHQTRTLPKQGINRSIIEWLGDRIPDDSRLNDIAVFSIQQQALRPYQRATLKFVRDIPKSYRAFRRVSLKNGLWYLNATARPQYIEPAELDLIILAMLKTARKLINERFVKQNIEQASFTLINLINDTFKNQILVDEATDFSPLQLSCMEALTTPSIGSFFACGDFNQRITDFGMRTDEQFTWISKSIETRSINTIYRQSHSLNDFAAQLLGMMGGDLSNRGVIPEHVNHIGVKPSIAEHLNSTVLTAKWLRDRISEVESAVKILPTIAVLVNTEEEVKPLAEALSYELEDLNIRAVPCSDGQSLGEGNDVRVFDLQHIKGLEFEAVFFVGVDTLSKSNPKLFEKYLYVGATRAATYFGVTCAQSIPESLEDLRSSFVEHW